MPKVEDFAGLGKPADDTNVNMNIDIILNPLGVINRLNPSQLLEVEFNYNSKYIRYMMEQNWEDNTLDDLKEYLLDYIHEVNEEQYEFTRKYLDNLNDEELEEFLRDIIKNGIPLYQSPFYNNQNILDLKNIYDYTEAERTKLKNIENTVIFGEEYFMALKHLPISKFSARSVDQLSIKNLPVKSNLYKQHKSDFSTTPIKIGEMESIGLNLANPANKDSMKKVKYFLDCYANNEEDRINFLKAQVTKNPYDFDFESNHNRSVNSKILRSFLTCLQLEPEDDEED